MKRMLGAGILVTISGWALLGIVTTFYDLPVWGFPDRPNPRFVRTASDLESWLEWSASLLLAALVVAIAIAGRRRSIRVSLGGWTNLPVGVFGIAVVSYVVSGIWTLSPERTASLSSVGDDLFFKMRFIHQVSSRIGIWALIVLIAIQLIRPTKTQRENSSPREGGFPDLQ